MTKQTAKKSKQAEPKRQLGAMLLAEGRSGLIWLGSGPINFIDAFKPL